jgi:hypothetical protein
VLSRSVSKYTGWPTPTVESPPEVSVPAGS